MDRETESECVFEMGSSPMESPPRAENLSPVERRVRTPGASPPLCTWVGGLEMFESCLKFLPFGSFMMILCTCRCFAFGRRPLLWKVAFECLKITMPMIDVAGWSVFLERLNSAREELRMGMLKEMYLGYFGDGLQDVRVGDLFRDDGESGALGLWLHSYITRHTTWNGIPVYNLGSLRYSGFFATKSVRDRFLSFLFQRRDAVTERIHQIQGRVDSSVSRQLHVVDFLLDLTINSFTFKVMNAVSRGWGSRRSPYLVSQRKGDCGLYVDVSEVYFDKLTKEYTEKFTELEFTEFWFSYDPAWSDSMLGDD